MVDRSRIMQDCLWVDAGRVEAEETMGWLVVLQNLKTAMAKRHSCYKRQMIWLCH